MRRAAIPLAGGIARLLERWRAETDPTVRIPLLLGLGEAVAGEANEAGMAGEAGADQAGGAVDDARAVLARMLEGDDLVMWVAAVHASAEFDPDLPVRQMDRLIEVFSDIALRPRFEEAWFIPDFEGPWTREDLVGRTAWRLRHDPEAECRFAVRLVETVNLTGDSRAVPGGTGRGMADPDRTAFRGSGPAAAGWRVADQSGRRRAVSSREHPRGTGPGSGRVRRPACRPARRQRG
ncbi:hypothetical protein ABZW30_33780 [Kitasatospora sp. NPDC004669]|uniref:hypothetical protein n=1 Tax=Kitasatospora sp. NPDC004669 TaxID=3154555 RepID=UPI0033B1D5DA